MDIRTKGLESLRFLSFGWISFVNLTPTYNLLNACMVINYNVF